LAVTLAQVLVSVPNSVSNPDSFSLDHSLEAGGEVAIVAPDVKQIARLRARIISDRGRALQRLGITARGIQSVTHRNHFGEVGRSITEA